MNKKDEWLIRMATITGYIISFLLGLYYFSDLISNGIS